MLKLKYQSQDDIPEEARDHYVERDGAYVLDTDTPFKTQSEIDKMESALNKERRDRREAERAVRELEDTLPDDFDRDKWDAMKNDKTPDEIRQQLREKHDSEKQALEQQSEELQQSLNRVLIDNGLQEALVNNGITKPPYLRAVKKMLKDEAKVVEQDDEHVAVAGEYEEPLDKFVAKWVKTDEGKEFVTASNNRGGGSGGGGGGDDVEDVDNPYTKEGWHFTKQAQLEQDDPDQARKLIKAAGKDPAAFDL